MSKRASSTEYSAVTAAAMKGMGRRLYQEDTYIIASRDDGRVTLAMVADGMGGMQDGRYASRTAVGIVKNAFMHCDLGADMGEMLREAVKAANDALYAKLKLEGGSTGIACVFRDGQMYYAGMGDSFLMLRRGHSLYRLNCRQNLYYSMCLEQIRRGSTDKSAAENHPRANALTGYLGMKELTDIDTFRKPLPLLPGDALLLCSDGVGDVLDDKRLIECLLASTPEEACRRLDEAVFSEEHEFQDNYTAVVVMYK